MIRDAVVLAGGLGTRIQSVTRGRIPKALIPIQGRPFIDFKLQSLATMGVRRVVMLVGKFGPDVESHVGDGSAYGLEISFRHDGDKLLGTAGAIRGALDILPDCFWVTYGDSIGFANLGEIENLMFSRKLSGAMTVLRNLNQWDTSNVAVHGQLVTSYGHSQHLEGVEWIDYGLLLLPRAAFESLPGEETIDLSVVKTRLIEANQMMAAPVKQRFWEVGSVEGLRETSNFLDNFKSQRNSP